MPHDLHFPILAQLGINPSEALVYELLLELGPKPAQDLITPSGLGRGNLYNVLTSLKKKGLVSEVEGKKTVFTAAPPNKLQSLLEAEQKRISQISAALGSIMPLLSSEFHLSTGKPVIQVYEGLEGAEKAIFDSIDSKTEVLTYYDFSAMKDKLADIDDRYYAAYAKKGIQKRILVTDSTTAHAYFADAMIGTRVGFVPNFPAAFNAGIQIYDSKVSFVSLKNDRLISVIMADPTFYEMMRQFFEFHWSLAKNIVGPAIKPPTAMPAADASGAK